MGVQNLTQLINANPWLTKDVKLTKTKLVIDGRALHHFIYDNSVNKQTNSEYGGDYVTFDQDWREFSKLLADCSIEPIVILPGGKHPDIPHVGVHLGHKTETVGTKLKKPVLCSFVRSTLLKELKVEHVRARFDGEVDAVLLANALKCPLLVQDSEYYVLDAEYGVIMFDQLRMADHKKITIGLPKTKTQSVDDLNLALSSLTIDGDNVKITPKHLNGKIFYRQDFLDAFDNLKPEVLPLFCTIVGNSIRRREFPYDQTFATIKHLGIRNINRKFYASSKNTRSLLELLTWLQNKTFDQAFEMFTRRLPRPDKRSDIRSDFRACVQFTDNWMNGHYTLDCLVNHVEGRNCDRDHSFKWQDRVISDEIVRRVIEDKVTPSLISIYFHGVLTLMTQNEDYDQESSFKVALDLLKSFTSMIRPEAGDSSTVTVLDRQSRGQDGEVCKETHGMLLLPNTRLKNGLKMPCWSELEQWSQDNKRLLAYLVLNLNQDDSDEIECVIKEISQEVIEVTVHEKELTILVGILKYISTKLRVDENKILFKKVSIAIFVSSIYYLTKKAIFNNQDLIERNLKPIGCVNQQILHCYAQFQAVLRMYSQVNALLDYPTPAFDIGSMFNGVLIHNLVVNSEKLIVPENVTKLFE